MLAVSTQVLKIKGSEMLIDTTYHGKDGSESTVTMHLATEGEKSLTDAALARIASNQHLLRWDERTRTGTAYATAKALRSRSQSGAQVKRSGHVVTVLLPRFALLVSGN